MNTILIFILPQNIIILNEMCNYNGLLSCYQTLLTVSARRLHMTFREIECILKANNWILIRITGSHYQYRKAGIPNAVVVPNHNGKDITIGVIKDLEKKTGLTLRN